MNIVHTMYFFATIFEIYLATILNKKQEMRLALCNSKPHAYAIIRQTLLRVAQSHSPFFLLIHIALYLSRSSTTMRSYITQLL